MPDPLTEADKESLTKLLGSPLDFPQPFKDWLQDYVALQLPLIPYKNFLGAKLNIAKSSAYIAASEGTLSATYTDLTTVGPTITGLVDGQYVFLYGAHVNANDLAWFSISINGAAASDDQGAMTSWQATLVRAHLATVKNANSNSVQMKYRNGHGGTTKSFSNRWLAAIRVATG